MDFTGILPVELILQIMTFMPFVQVVKLQNICYFFQQLISDSKRKDSFWRELVGRDWSKISQLNRFIEMEIEMNELSWSASENGWFQIGKTLWIQSKNIRDPQWGIKKTNNVIEEGLQDDKGLQGRGKSTWANGNSYVGDWKNNQMEGKGKYNWISGAFYEGDWKEGLQEGQGRYIWSNKDVYEGNCARCVIEGEGSKFYSNGDVYKGHWEQDKRGGFGVMTWKGGGKYEGNWKRDKREGLGIMISSNGSTYVGEWSEDVKTGKGEMKWADGSILEGEWHNSRLLGVTEEVTEERSVPWECWVCSSKDSLIMWKCDSCEDQTLCDGCRSVVTVCAKGESLDEDHELVRHTALC